MTVVRLISYVFDPYRGETRPIAALVRDDTSTRLVRAPLPQLTNAVRGNITRILEDFEARLDFDTVPFEAGALAVAGDAISVPDGLGDASKWVQEVLLGLPGNP